MTIKYDYFHVLILFISFTHLSLLVEYYYFPDLLVNYKMIPIVNLSNNKIYLTG